MSLIKGLRTSVESWSIIVRVKRLRFCFRVYSLSKRVTVFQVSSRDKDQGTKPRPSIRFCLFMIDILLLSRGTGFVIQYS